MSRLCLAIVVCASLATTAPAPEKVKTYVWRKSIFTAETHQLAAMPWFRNYRVLSLLLLAAAVVFIYIWR